MDLRMKHGRTLTVIKYAFSYVIALLAFTIHKHIDLFLAGLIELTTIIMLSDVLIFLFKNLWIRVLAGIVLFIFNVEMVVLFYANSFITPTMIDNFHFIKDIGGKAVEYSLGIFIVCLFNMIPQESILYNIKRKKIIVFSIISCVFAETVLIMHDEIKTPLTSMADLIAKEVYYHKLALFSEGNNDIDIFYKESVKNEINRPEIIQSKPNVIVIFAEGLSENIIHDYKDLMPNIVSLEENSISFERYYNHTFATLRGLEGQLYSSYQIEDHAVNPLPSLQSILKDNGYYTAFINTEPENHEFETYLYSMKFDDIVEDRDHISGYINTMTDREAYDLLFDTAISCHSKGTPFLLGIYTFGTHATFDSDENKYGNGKYPLLNKFHNLDIQFGCFFEKFCQSELTDDTILVFTTDHATYADQDFTDAFPEYVRKCTDLDEIPFCIYYSDIQSDTIDTRGCNSLCFTPTLLDFLDITGDNYFLGDSLFGNYDPQNKYITTFYDASYIRSTCEGAINTINKDDAQAFMKTLTPFFSVMSNDEGVGVSIEADIDKNKRTIELSLNEYTGGDSVWFAVWSNQYDQDDLEWIQADNMAKVKYTASISIDSLNSSGEISINAYHGEEQAEEYLVRKGLFLDIVPRYHTELKYNVDSNILSIMLDDASQYEKVKFAVWKNEGDGNDLAWYDAEKSDDRWNASINMKNHIVSNDTNIAINIYGFSDKGEPICLRELYPVLEKIHE